MQTGIDDQGRLDVETLMRLARDKAVSSRTELADIISDLFFDANGTLSDAERTIMTDILRQLVQDAEVAVRKHLAIQLSNKPDAPHDLVVALANDECEVAYPLLVKSTVLRDQDLIAIIHHRTQEHQLAITMRETLSPTVSAALVGTCDETVIRQLLDNHNSDIARDTMAHLVDETRRVDSLQQPVVLHKDLPADLAEKMYWWVSAALRKHIVDNFDIDPTEVDSAMEASVNTVLGTEDEEKPAPTATDRIAKHLAENGPADGGLILRLLREGEVALFERVLEQETGLRRRLLQRLVYEPGAEGLAIVCRAIGLDAEDFKQVLALIRKARIGLEKDDSGDYAYASMFYEQLGIDAAQEILSHWRRNPVYLDMLRQLESLPEMPARPAKRTHKLVG